MRLYFLVLLIFLGGCSLNQHVLNSNTYPQVEGDDLQRWNNLLGRWHGEMEIKGGGLHEWFAAYYPDGTYSTDFITHNPDGTKSEKTEVGQWGVSGNILFKIYRGDVVDSYLVPVDASDPTNYDAYFIESLDDKGFSYRHARTHDLFFSKKVPEITVPPSAL